MLVSCPSPWQQARGFFTQRWLWLSFSGGLLAATAGSALGQELIAFDDLYAIPAGFTLEVEPFGVLENDLLDDENAGESGATAALVSGVSHGTLNLSADGSFTYQPGPGFDGNDSFVYRAEFGSVFSEATVVVSACDRGAELIDCWNENEFLAELNALGYNTFTEGFEDDGVWGGVRTPNRAPGVVSQGILWTSNHPDPPVENPITTGEGAQRSGQWGIFDPFHGYATGTPTQCDIDNPPEHCLYHDGLTGTRETGLLYGVGGYFDGIHGARIAIHLDDGPPLGGGSITSLHEFYGVISTQGFSKFQFREQEGKIGQSLFVWGDDFTLVTDDVATVAPPELTVTTLKVTPSPTRQRTALSFALTERSHVKLTIHSANGRLINRLVDGDVESGHRSFVWSGHDSFGMRVPAGVYFARLAAGQNPGQVANSRIVIVN